MTKSNNLLRWTLRVHFLPDTRTEHLHASIHLPVFASAWGANEKEIREPQNNEEAALQGAKVGGKRQRRAKEGQDGKEAKGKGAC